MNLLILTLLTIEHICVGGLLMITRASAMLLELWAKSIYRRLDRLTARA